jgi:hypothetical protein
MECSGRITGGIAMRGSSMRSAAALAAAMALGGCVGYGYPGDGGYSAYPGNGGAGPYPGADPGRTFRCESHDRKRNHCAVDTRYGVSIVRRVSDAPCVQGRTWGWDGAGVWVDDGCRAEFAVGGRVGGSQYPGSYGQGRIVQCGSHDRKYKRCNVSTGRGVQMQKQRSDAPCIQGSSWGWDRGGIWVDHGCRADFLVY